MGRIWRTIEHKMLMARVRIRLFQMAILGTLTLYLQGYGWSESWEHSWDEIYDMLVKLNRESGGER
jgi:hypothetical protein